MDNYTTVEKEKLEAFKSDVIVWRNLVRDIYPWPSDIDCLKFALTELSEALDAELRMNRTFKRNNVKDHSVKSELGDALFMILSFEKYEPGSVIYVNAGPANLLAAISALANATILLMQVYAGNVGYTLEKDVFPLLDVTLSFIFGHTEFDEDALYQTIKKIDDKHVKPIDKKEIM